MGRYNFGKTGPKFDGVSLYPALASVTTTAVPASGSCDVQFFFKDVSGNDLTSPVSGLLYLSKNSAGLTHDLADTSLAVVTNGVLTNIGGAGPSLFTTTATGVFDLRITAAADDYYVVFVKPDGSLLISDVCTVNA